MTLVDGTIPVAADFNGNYQALNNAIGSSTAISSYTTGDTLYASGTNTLSKLTAGTSGQVLTIASGIPAWAGGAWSSVSYSAGNFTANGAMTWTVDSGDVTTLAYILIGKTITVAFNIVTSTVGGTPNTNLRIVIPGGSPSAKAIRNLIQVSDNGTTGVGMAEVTAAGTTINLYKDVAGANWTASTNNTAVIGEITFEIQ